MKKENHCAEIVDFIIFSLMDWFYTSKKKFSYKWKLIYWHFIMLTYPRLQVNLFLL